MSEKNKIILHEDNIIDLRNIRSLSGLNFYIPDYQRGYRWTPSLAIQMLDDFKEFIEDLEDEEKNPGQFYCLQPIVVKPFEKEGRIFYELIDGQQRLTTLLIILKHLEDAIRSEIGKDKFKHFCLTYQTPRHSLGDENLIDHIINGTPDIDANVDDFYMQLVSESIKEWFDENGMRGKMASFILGERLDKNDNNRDKAKNVRVLWYEIGTAEKDTSVNIFTHLNIGKIPLTNGELIKASFIRSSSKKLSEKIAREWDVIEQKLQNDKFWYFLRKSKSLDKYETRIELIFDLISGWEKDKEFYWTFNHFSNLIADKSAEIVWMQVKDYFRELEYWFKDNNLFHLLGFLIECGVTIPEVKKLAIVEEPNSVAVTQKEPKRRTKSEFLKEIKVRVKEKMSDVDVSKITYNDDDKIRRTLLLFNILSVSRDQKSEVRFPFHNYKNSKMGWDKEHIASQTENVSTPEGADRGKWVEDMTYYFTGINIDKIESSDDDQDRNEAYISKIKDYLAEKMADQRDKYNQEINYIIRLVDLKESLAKKKRTPQENDILSNKFKDLYTLLAKEFTKEDLEDKDGIGNIALLNPEINRSYGNAFFAIKRMIIRDKDEAGIFIPIATRNAFMKYYSPKVTNMFYWTKEDADAYRKAIVTVLDEYLTIKPN